MFPILPLILLYLSSKVQCQEININDYYDDDLHSIEDGLKKSKQPAEPIASDSQLHPQLFPAPPAATAAAAASFHHLAQNQGVAHNVQAHAQQQLRQSEVRGKLVPEPGWLPIVTAYNGGSDPEEQASAASIQSASFYPKRLVDNPLAIVAKDKQNAPPITVFPNDTIVIHYETVDFEQNAIQQQQQQSTGGPRSERATIPKTIESRLESLKQSCNAVDIEEFIVDLLRSPIRVRNEILTKFEANKKAASINTEQQDDRRPKAVNGNSLQKEQTTSNVQQSTPVSTPAKSVSNFQQQNVASNNFQQQNTGNSISKANSNAGKIVPQKDVGNGNNFQQNAGTVTAKTESATGNDFQQNQDGTAIPPKEFISAQFSNFPAFKQVIEGQHASNVGTTSPPLTKVPANQFVKSDGINNAVQQQQQQPTTTTKATTQTFRTAAPTRAPTTTQTTTTQPAPTTTVPVQSKTFVPQQVNPRINNGGGNKAFTIEKFLERYPEVRRVSSRFGDNKTEPLEGSNDFQQEADNSDNSNSGQSDQPQAQQQQQQQQQDDGPKRQDRRQQRKQQKQQQKQERQQKQQPAKPAPEPVPQQPTTVLPPLEPPVQQESQTQTQAQNVQHKQPQQQKQRSQPEQILNSNQQAVTGFEIAKVGNGTGDSAPPKKASSKRKAKRIQSIQSNKALPGDGASDFEDKDPELSSDEYSYLYYQDYYDELVPEHHRFNNRPQESTTEETPPESQQNDNTQATFPNFPSANQASSQPSLRPPAVPIQVGSSPVVPAANPVQTAAAPVATVPALPSTEAGPFGFPEKGTFFSDAAINAFPDSIEVIYQGFVWALKVTYPAPTGSIMHGGVHTILQDKVKKETVKLKDDYIVRVTGRSSPYNINLLTFYTAKGKKYGPWGERKSENSSDFDVSAPEGQGLAFISGTLDFGVPLRSISLHWRPR